MEIEKLSIIIPAYNEANTIHLILNKIKAVQLTNDIKKEIIIVNDYSSDNTAEAIAGYQLANPELNIQYFEHEFNKGKGAALHTGISKATGDYLIIQDADLEYDPAEFPKLTGPIADGRADVVFGSRFAGGECHRVLYFWHSIANRILTLMSNAATNLNLTDMETCYKCFRREVIQSLTIEENRFGFEPEVTAKVAKWRGADGRRCRVYEVGISYSGRTYEEGKKIGWKDGVRALWCIVKYR